jgi:AcrR family transcriptional regulator
MRKLLTDPGRTKVSARKKPNDRYRKMGTKGERTREHVLATAETLILNRGYSGTSIDEIISRSGLTKGGFFYHFDGKADLARHLMLRYLERDMAFFVELSERSRSLVEDPLQRFLLFLKLLAESMADLPDIHPGCLIASFTYEAQQFDEQVKCLNAEGLLSWRKLFLAHLEEIAEKYPPNTEQPLEGLADLLSSIMEGGIIMSKVLEDSDALPSQLLHYRNYIRLLFNAEMS